MIDGQGNSRVSDTNLLMTAGKKPPAIDSAISNPQFSNGRIGQECDVLGALFQLVQHGQARSSNARP